MYKLASKIAEKAEKIAAAAKEAAKLIPDDVHQRRIDICTGCEHLYAPSFTCKKCGCFMKVKTYLPNAACPIGKWAPYVKPEEQSSKD